MKKLFLWLLLFCGYAFTHGISRYTTTTIIDTTTKKLIFFKDENGSWRTIETSCDSKTNECIVIADNFVTEDVISKVEMEMESSLTNVKERANMLASCLDQETVDFLTNKTNKDFITYENGKILIFLITKETDAFEVLVREATTEELKFYNKRQAAIYTLWQQKFRDMLSSFN